MGYRNPVVRGIGVLELFVPFLLFPNLKRKLSANIPEMVHSLPFLIGCRCRVGVGADAPLRTLPPDSDIGRIT